MFTKIMLESIIYADFVQKPLFFQDQIENMVREAEANAEQDKVNRERVEAINQAEGILHDTESKMDEFKDQLPSEDIAKMKEKIQEVRDKLQDKENMDPEDIKKTVSDLQQSSLKLFEMAYKKMAADKDSSSSSGESSGESSEKKSDSQQSDKPSLSSSLLIFIQSVTIKAFRKCIGNLHKRLL